MHARAISVLLALVLAAGGGLVPSPLVPSAAAATVSARTLLFRIPLAAESGWSTYNRNAFGYPADLDHDCRNTRAEVLLAESRVAVKFTSASHCYIRTGRWYSYYDGVWGTVASKFQIDHMVPLYEAWISGARSWTAADRLRYGNDTGYGPSMAVVTISANSSKSGQDPASWLPPRVASRCTYAIQWVEVKYRWRLKMDSAERSALARILTGACGARLVAVPPRGR